MLWIALIAVFGCGLTGGVINAMLSDNGFALPRRVIASGTRIVSPGFLGNALIGGVAAAISWGLYGPFAGINLAEGVPAGASPPLTPSTLAGAILVGVAGARWLTNEVDKKLLRAAGSEAAALTTASADLQRAFASGSPAEAFRVAMNAPG